MQRREPMRRTPIKRTRFQRTRKPRVVKPTPNAHDEAPEFWVGQRHAISDRAGFRCERCGTHLHRSGFEAHHRKLRSQGGLHGLENLACLCPDCHRAVHAHPTTAVLAGWIVPSVCDPAIRAVQLHDGRTVLLTSDGGYDVVPFPTN